MDFYFIGDPELVTAFRFIGIEGSAVRDAAEAVSVFTRITGMPNCRVLMLTEEVSLWLDDLLVDWQISGRYPLIVEIPGINGRLPGRKTLVDAIREAIGIHV